MDTSPNPSENQKINVKNVIYSKNPTLARAVPGFVINYLKRIVHQDELNEFLGKWGHLRDSELIEAGLKHFEIKFKVFNSENIPESGRYIFVSNHPLGGLDGLVFIYELSKHFNKIKFPVNDILTNIKNLSGIFLPVNKHGSLAKEAARMIEEAYSSDCQILNFPAGAVFKENTGRDQGSEMAKSFITKSIQHKRDVIPAFFSGRNSNFFYNIANFRKMLSLKANIEMLYLADEMFKQKDKEITLVFGNPIPWETFDKSRSALEWADWVKSKSYELESFIS